MDIFDEMKKFSGMTTTEQIFGIGPQPPEMCPAIDELIYDVADRLKTISGYAKDVYSIDDAEAQSLAKDILWYSEDDSHKAELNSLREQIDLLRHWGQGWKDLAKSLIQKETDFGRLTDNLEGFGTNKNSNPL